MPGFHHKRLKARWRRARSEGVSEEAAVKSPCISVCALDEEDICMGCFRSLREISDWVLALLIPWANQGSQG